MVDAGVRRHAPPARAARGDRLASHLLLTYNGATQSEVVSFGLPSSSLEGRLTFDDFIGGAYVGPTAPWLLEESTDLVARLDATQPWTVTSSWNVRLNDLTDAGYAQPYSDPTAVVAATASKAYVFRYNRNLVAIIDPSKSVDAGAPTGTIDLSE